MDKLDIYYRALIDFRKNTLENNECARQRKAIARADEASDIIEVEKTECEIEDDWIEAIEEGLDAIGKAIAEERQFILSNGEVTLIEKVKSVSKESVEHLARHSELITKEPKENGDIIPDKLYTVERLTDFAVYENRFLYMLLCYLKEFISVRYNAIVELTTTYSGKMSMNKTVNTGNRKLFYSVTLDEKKRNDEFLFNNNPTKEKIDRIDGLLKAVVSYLATPLMDEVSKAPMLKPPITETNVLKMNRNFKAAVKLYYFVTSYTKKGYSYKKETCRMNPFKEQVADEFAEAVELSSFLTYEYGMGVQEIFKENYREQLKAEKKQAEQKKLEQIKSLRKRIKDSGESPEEYMLMLEQRNKTLEADSVRLVSALAEIAELTEAVNTKDAIISQQHQEIERLNGVVKAKEEEIVRLTEEYEQKIADLTAEYEQKIADLTAEYEQKIADLTNEYEQKIYDLNQSHNAEIERLGAEYAANIQALKAEHQAKEEEIIAAWQEKLQSERDAHAAVQEGIRLSAAREKEEYNNKLAAVAKEYTECNKLLEETRKQLEAEKNTSALKDARLNALKKKSGEFSGDEDYISREGFDELERQYYAIKAEYLAFEALYKEQWKLTKKDIRKKYLKASVPEKKKKSSEDNAQTKEPVTQAENTDINKLTEDINHINGGSSADGEQK